MKPGDLVRYKIRPEFAHEQYAEIWDVMDFDESITIGFLEHNDIAVILEVNDQNEEELGISAKILTPSGLIGWVKERYIQVVSS